MKTCTNLLVQLLVLIILFFSCKEDGIIQSKQETTQTVTNAIMTSSDVVVDKDGSEVILETYLEDRIFRSNKPTTEIITNEIGEEYLVVRYFSGGAHCCTITDILFKDKGTRNYYIVDSFGEDGEGSELEYPFSFNIHYDYFYSCYACIKHLKCSDGVRQEQSLKSGKIITKIVGSKSKFKKCFIDYLSSNSIPELNSNGDDDGERKLILNAISDLRLASMEYDDLLEIYLNYTNDFEDKKNLWIEILEKIGCTSSSTLTKHRQILTKQKNE